MYIRCAYVTERDAKAHDAMTQNKKAKKNPKDGQLVIRVNKADRDEFIALCDDLDTSAAREIRAFMKRFVREHGAKAED